MKTDDFSVTASAAGTAVTLGVNGTDDYDEAFKVVELVNKERKARGLSTLTMDKELMAAAFQRAAENTVLYDHTRPDGTGFETAVSRDWGAVAENIAYGYPDAASVVSGWMNSDGHRANILTSVFRSIGVGCRVAADGTRYWTQIFDDNTPSPASASGSKAVKHDIKVLASNLHLEGEIKDSSSGGKQIVITHKNTDVPSYTVIDSGSFDYSISDPSVADIDASGRVTVKSDAGAVITATLKSNKAIHCRIALGPAVLPPYTATVDPFSLGDPNGDAVIDSSDASLILSHYAAISTTGRDIFDERQLAASDVDSDGISDSYDASVILSYYSFIATGGEADLELFIEMFYITA